MIHIRKQPETQSYVPQPASIAWIKTRMDNAEMYKLELIDDAPAIDMNAGLRNRGLVPAPGLAYAKLSLLESGAVLASFPLLGKMPGNIQADPFTVWFVLDAPAILPANVFGREILFASGRHLMTTSLGNWVVFFRPAPHHNTTIKTP
jgi:hypothetical protein